MAIGNDAHLSPIFDFSQLAVSFPHGGQSHSVKMYSDDVTPLLKTAEGKAELPGPT